MDRRDIYDILVTDLEIDFEEAINNENHEKIWQLMRQAQDIKESEIPAWECERDDFEDPPEVPYFLKQQAS